MMKARQTLMLLFLLVSTTLFAQKFTLKDPTGCAYEFKVTSKTDRQVALVSASNKKTPKLEIPGKVTHKGVEYTVTRVMSEALKDCDTELRVLSFPNTVTEIEGYLFGSSMKLMGGFAGAMSGGKGERPMSTITLESLRIPASVMDIGYYAFMTSLSTRGTKGLRAHIDELPKCIAPQAAEMYGLQKSAVTEYWERTDPSMLSSGAGIPVQTGLMATAPIPAAAPVATATKPAQQLTSDVDKDLPKTNRVNESTFALIIANENYQEEVPVEYAGNDGEAFKMYCQQVLGIPEENINMRKDATLNNMLAALDWVNMVAKAFSGEAKVIFFYAGHGVPDEATGAAYLLPVDGIGRNLRTGYSLTELYKQLGALPVKNVTVFMDACFSGAKRGNGMLASARGVAIKAKQQEPQGKMVVLSAAQSDETAYPYKEKQHGLFTYYLLKKLQESRGDCTMQELSDYVKTQVSRRSVILNQKSQTPSIGSSTALGDAWKDLKLNN